MKTDPIEQPEEVSRSENGKGENRRGENRNGANPSLRWSLPHFADDRYPCVCRAVTEADGRIVCEIPDPLSSSPYHFYPSHEECVRNARLIHAAPDLLHALDSILANISWRILPNEVLEDVLRIREKATGIKYEQNIKTQEESSPEVNLKTHQEEDHLPHLQESKESKENGEIQKYDRKIR